MTAETKPVETMRPEIQSTQIKMVDELLAMRADIPWPMFLAALEAFCDDQGWILEYETVKDESCAIFYQPRT